MEPARLARAAAFGAAALLGGCPEPAPSVEPILPRDYLDTFLEVRDCRQSGDHDLERVRVLADPAAYGPYVNRDAPFPPGSIVVKEQYEFGDLECSGPILRWTVMRRLEDGEDPAFLDWEWQEIDADFEVVEPERAYECVNCHERCEGPGAYMGTCTEE